MFARDRYKSFGSVEGILKSAIALEDSLTNKIVVCHFQSNVADKVESALGRRVYIYGLIHSTEDGEKVRVEVEELEVFLNEGELPTIEDMVGILGSEN